MLAVGDIVGDWVVERTLGEGASGQVFLARNRLTERIEAALKVFKPRPHSNDRDRFEREVEALDALRHEAIVGVKGWGEDSERGLLWLALERIDGEELGQLVARGPLDTDRAVLLFATLADGLEAAHQRGICHRDIKPANLLVGRQDDPHLVDFGIAMETGRTRLTQGETMPGTPAYMAPEQFELLAPDAHKVDVYALGQCLYEALTAELAFPESPNLTGQQQLVHLVHRKVQSAPLDPGEGFPDALRALVRHATEPDPEQRLATAAAFRDGLFTLLPSMRPIYRAPSSRFGIAVALGAGIVVSTAIICAMGRSPTPVDGTRDALVLLGGIGADTPVVLQLNGQPPDRYEGHEYLFEDVPTGEMYLAVAAGDQCDFLAFDGSECPACCACHLQTYPLELGDEADTTLVTLPESNAVAARDLHIDIIDLPEGWPVELTIDGHPADTVDNGRSATWHGLNIGRHELVASVGDCPADAAGCANEGECPDGCRSRSGPIGVSCGSGVQPLALALDPPFASAPGSEAP